MPFLSWVAVLALTIAAVLIGRTAREVARGGRHPGRQRFGTTLSISGPLLVAGVGLVWAVLTGNWVPAAAGTAGALILTAGLGLALAP